MFAMSTGRRIWHPIPAIAEHDTTVESTYGNDHHPFRDVCVTWRDGDICGWMPEELGKRRVLDNSSKSLIDSGRCYSSTHAKCLQWVIGFSETQYRACEAARPPLMFHKWMGGT